MDVIPEELCDRTTIVSSVESNNSNNNNNDHESMPFYCGEKGWVSPAWQPPPPKYSYKQPHSDEGGWVSSNWKPSSRSTTSNKEAAKGSVHHTGKKGWVAPKWEESYSGSPFVSDNIIPSAAQPYHPSSRMKSTWEPAVSVANGPNTILVEVELPGVNKQDVFVEILQQESTPVPLFENEENSKAIVLPSSQISTSYLFIKGYKHNRWVSQKVWDERSYGYFEKSIYIGSNVNRDSPIMAKMADGVLTICVHRPLAID